MSTGLNRRQCAALSGIWPRCFSLGSCGPRSWRTLTRSCPGSAGLTTLCWRTRWSYSSPLQSFCKRCYLLINFFISIIILCNIVVMLLTKCLPSRNIYCVSIMFLLISCAFFFFRIVIYIHTQVVDGQRRIISRLEKQNENVCIVKQESVSLASNVYICLYVDIYGIYICTKVHGNPSSSCRDMSWKNKYVNIVVAL